MTLLEEAVNLVNTIGEAKPILTVKNCIGCSQQFAVTTANAAKTDRCRFCQKEHHKATNALNIKMKRKRNRQYE